MLSMSRDLAEVTAESLVVVNKNIIQTKRADKIVGKSLNRASIHPNKTMCYH